jgi:hypothetical protein
MVQGIHKPFCSIRLSALFILLILVQDTHVCRKTGWLRYSLSENEQGPRADTNAQW